MATLVPCKDCKHKVSKAAATCPKCGVKNPANRTSFFTGLLAIIFTLIVVSALLNYDYTDEQRAATATQNAEDVLAGFHCLSSFNGSHPSVVAYVEENLNDPSSFDHVETRITPVDEAGEHTLVMTYRANNSFGALMLLTAVATIRNSDCLGTITLIE